MRMFAAIRNSLIAQLSILFAFALGLFLFTVFAIPAMSLLDRTGHEAPATMTRVKFAVMDGLENNRTRDEILANNLVAEVVELNPQINIYGRVAEREFLIGVRPKEFAVPNPQGFSIIRSTTDEVCDTSSAVYLYGRKDDGLSLASATACTPKGEFFQISGLKVPLETESHLLSAYWEMFKLNLIERLGLSLLLFVVAAFVIGRVINALRKVVDLAAHQFAESRDGELPEQGIPIEVRPMVRKLNELFARVRGEAERQRFFLAASAHELRTPLTILRTRMAELPENDTRSAMEGDVRRMARLLEQLLRLTKLANQVELAKERIDLNSVGRKACAHRAVFAHENGVELEFVACPGPCQIHGNAAMVDSAVTNVIDNAISVTPKGGKVVVTVSANREVVVEDEGPGLSPQIADKLFEPFSKFPPNRRGSGLGLAIVDAVMRLHEGEARIVPSTRGTKLVLHFSPRNDRTHIDASGA